MYGYGTVEYHLGRAGSARATYTSASSQAACHRASNARRSISFGVETPFLAARGLLVGAPVPVRGFAARRGDGERCRFAGLFLRRVGFDARRRDGRLARRVRAGDFLRATSAHRRRSRKAFAVYDPRFARVFGRKTTPSIW